MENVGVFLEEFDEFCYDLQFKNGIVVFGTANDAGFTIGNDLYSIYSNGLNISFPKNITVEKSESEFETFLLISNDEFRLQLTSV